MGGGGGDGGKESEETTMLNCLAIAWTHCPLGGISQEFPGPRGGSLQAADKAPLPSLQDTRLCLVIHARLVT